MAKVILDDYKEKSVTFDLEKFIYLGFNKNRSNLILCVKDKKPKNIPITPGNIRYLNLMFEYQKLFLCQEIMPQSDEE